MQGNGRSGGYRSRIARIKVNFDKDVKRLIVGLCEQESSILNHKFFFSNVNSNQNIFLFLNGCVMWMPLLRRNEKVSES
jgi:hypothetical protein